MNLSKVRGGWASRIGVSPALVRLAEEVPTPRLASHSDGPDLRNYLAWWITHPDPGGAFARRTRWLRRLPAGWLVRVLFARGYEGLIYRKDAAIIGHVFFQQRGADVHGFSTAVDASLDGEGYSVVMMFDFVAHSLALPGVARVRVGSGQNVVTRRFLQRARKHEAALGWQVSDDGWIGFGGPATPAGA